jgi:hypothetical protein
MLLIGCVSEPETRTEPGRAGGLLEVGHFIALYKAAIAQG